MRKITFRGKTYDGMWIEGAYYHANKNYGNPDDVHCIIPTTESLDYEQALEYFVVSPVTVGQYTGLKDKNGKRIFEGDIVTRILFDELYQYEVVYQSGYASFYGIRKGGFISFGDDGDCFEVIGNIHDNPELLEVRQWNG